jgi:undecaprenyl pyrophosphate phosphatase UppP
MLPELSSVSTEAMSSMWIGVVAAMVSGIAAIWLFVKMLERQMFHLFSYYAWTVGGAFLVWVVLTGRG